MSIRTKFDSLGTIGRSEPILTECLCFTKKEENSSVSIVDYNSSAGTYFPSLKYSKNSGKTWTQYNGHIVYLDQCEDGKMYIKAIGYNPSGMSYTYGTSSKGSFRFKFTGSLECTGNLQYLISETGNIDSVPQYGFRYLFYRKSDEGSMDFKGILPATNLAEYCYAYMFNGCSSLVNPPELPATNLSSYCYYNMFNGCASLTSSPELPATNLAKYCYYRMFYNCTSLTRTPDLPATTIASYCYYSMFNGCSSLTGVTDLPATNLSTYCYSYMFNGCSSLVNPPELPATNLATYCYSRMFYNCTSLTHAPELPATNLATYCYSRMFYNCTSLSISENIEGGTVVLNLPTETEAKSNWNSYMFTNTAGTFTGDPSIGKTYRCYQ